MPHGAGTPVPSTWLTQTGDRPRLGEPPTVTLPTLDDEGIPTVLLSIDNITEPVGGTEREWVVLTNEGVSAASDVDAMTRLGRDIKDRLRRLLGVPVCVNCADEDVGEAGEQAGEEGAGVRWGVCMAGHPWLDQSTGGHSSGVGAEVNPPLGILPH